MTTPPSTTSPPASENMPLPSTIARTLKHFASSPNSFQIIHTAPPSLARLPTRTLYILDSSFNPPTFAHLRMCTAALLDDDKLPEAQRGKPKRLLLLLATQNADKPANPVAFEQRLAMMGLLAEEVRKVVREIGRGGDRDLLEGKGGGRKKSGVVEVGEHVPKVEGKGGVGKRDQVTDEGQKKRGKQSKHALENLQTIGPGDEEQAIIDVGVTKAAMFLEKARVIEESGFYSLPPGAKGDVEQVHLMGYDTLVRLFDKKYYPPERTLAPLGSLFKKHRVRVTKRLDDSQGLTSDQDGFLKKLANGELEEAGAEKEWVDQVQLVKGLLESGEKGVSSTRVRDQAKLGNITGARDLVPRSIIEHIVEQDLYGQTDG